MRMAQGTHAKCRHARRRESYSAQCAGGRNMNDIGSEFERLLGHAALKLGPTRSHSFIDQSPRIRYRAIR